MTSVRATVDDPEAFSRRFVTPLFTGAALNPINSTLIATALVPIAPTVHVSVGQTSVLVAALYLACAAAQPTAGKLAEEFGPRRVFLAGIMIILVAGVIGGLARNLTALTVARVLIGIGTSAGYPSAMLLIRRRAAAAGMREPPGGVLGGLSIAGTVTVAVGPPIGGLLVGALGWQAAFPVNIPLALCALAMTLRWIPRNPAATTPRNVREMATRIDVVGIIGFGCAITALLVFLLALPHPNWIAVAVFPTAHSPVILITGVTLILGITAGTTSTGNQTALHAQAPADQLGTASGLFRTFSYLGSIASSTITGIVFGSGVTDHGLHTLAYILVGVAATVLVLTVADRTPRR
ncbi:MAG TPA: MFS transporter [Pseudonocardiaceae bacterium]|nr:MFS transporter [Pseudonocardiaceae bacterium]